MKEVGNAYKNVVGKPKREKPAGRSRRRWEGNIKFNLKEIGCEGVNWIQLAQYSIQFNVILAPIEKKLMIIESETIDPCIDIT
jgi:hypothetical protein